MANWPDKDPNEKLDYTIDWSAALVGTDTIVDSIWTVDSDLETSGTSYDTTKTVIWLAGGTDGVKYNISNRVTTAYGRIMERTVILKVKTR